jgi:hypothetical protein
MQRKTETPERTNAYGAGLGPEFQFLREILIGRRRHAWLDLDLREGKGFIR